MTGLDRTLAAEDRAIHAECREAHLENVLRNVRVALNAPNADTSLELRVGRNVALRMISQVLDPQPQSPPRSTP